MHKRRSPRRNLFILGAIVIIVLGYFWYANSRYQYFISTPVNPGNPIDTPFIIKNGDNVSIIGQKLQEKDLILDQDAFKNYTKQNGFDRKVIAGRFMLNQSMTIPQIAEKITNPNQGEISLTIPEGTTIEGIDQKLVSLGVIQAGDFVQAAKDFSNYSKYSFLDQQKMAKLAHPLEGYLFPDTYFLDTNHYNSQDLIELMLNDFQKRLPSNAATTAQQNGRTLYDVITMASIVEKEVNTTDDRPIVAGILWKRLDSHWQLGADATLLYLKNDNTLNYKDLQENSPYNTRKNQGLPPGPICNPGLKAIEAALTPQTSKYFYYLTKPSTGEVVYAATNDEQNANRAKYLN